MTSTAHGSAISEAGARSVTRTGKIKYLAGSAPAQGAFVNDIAPEVAAQRLRDRGKGAS